MANDAMGSRMADGNSESGQRRPPVREESDEEETPNMPWWWYLTGGSSDPEAQRMWLQSNGMFQCDTATWNAHQKQGGRNPCSVQ